MTSERRHLRMTHAAATATPPETFAVDDWRDPADPIRRFLDDAYLRAVRRWLDARLEHNRRRTTR